VLRVLRTPRRICGRQIGNADHNGYPAVDRRDRSPVPPSGAIACTPLATSRSTGAASYSVSIVPAESVAERIDGYDDAIVGYDLAYVTITDPQVVATSGSDRHPILRPTDRPDAHVDGTVFTISEAELAAVNEYEVDDYRRISVPLRSGPHAWVYVFAGQPS
jgi:hypothetical protein